MTQQLPSVVIAGRPNVGKSTLFNRLSGARRAIVTNEPGITRDRIHGRSVWCGRPFEVVDTGGLLPGEKAGIPAEIMRQARVAIHAASRVVLVVDGRLGPAPLDWELMQLLRRAGKPPVIAVNKVDSPQHLALAAPFYELGSEVFPISAEHGFGVDDLLDGITADFPVSQLREREPEIDVAIIGRPNVGKSTLLNRLVGTERAIVSPEPGTTRDAVDTVVERDGKLFRFLDTAGIRRKGKTGLIAEKLSVIMARKHLERCDLALLVVDASLGVTTQDAAIAGYAQQSGRSIIVVMNKWDLAMQASRQSQEVRRSEDKTRGRSGAQSMLKKYEKIVRAKLKALDYAPLVFGSAKTGERLDKIFMLLEKVAAARERRIPTGELNRWLAEVDLERGTIPAGKKMKIYYITQAAVAPPTFVLFTNQVRPMYFSYQRFLENELRARFNFSGTPIRFILRQRRKSLERGERPAAKR